MPAVETRYGQLSVYDSEDELITQFLVRYGEWAWLETSLIAQLLSAGARVLDIGAYIGTFGLGLEAARGDLALIVYCEANPTLVPVLSDNVHRLSRAQAHVVEGVVSGHAAVREGHMPEGNMGALSFVEGAAGGLSVLPVHSTTLPALRANHGPFDLIKIDAEGMEHDILAADEEFLREHKPLLWLECLEDQRSLDLGAWLLSLGYELHYYAFSSFNPGNFRASSARVYPVAFEAGLLATREALTALPDCIPPGQAQLQRIRSREDLRQALWHTPRWGLSGWEELDTPGLTALAGRYFLNMRYETFLQPAQPAQFDPGEGGLAAGSLRSEWLGALKSAEAARAQAVAQLADREARLAALYRGRTAFLTEIEALRLAAEETRFAHQAEIAALREEIAQARDLVVQQSLETALVQDRLNQSQHVLLQQHEHIAAYTRRIAELEGRLGRLIAEMTLG